MVKCKQEDEELSSIMDLELGLQQGSLLTTISLLDAAIWAVNIIDKQGHSH